MIFSNQHTHGAPREVVAKSMGYNTLNGASATAISALTKYGLLEGRADEIRVSDRAMRILHPQSQAEKAEAIREAANAPELFRELAERFPGRFPAEEVVRSYLIRKGFAEAALSPVILSYRETNELVEREAEPYDSPVPAGAGPLENQPMQSLQTTGQVQKAIVSQAVASHGGALFMSYTFTGGRTLECRLFGDVPEDEALDMMETLITLKKKEIARNVQRAVVDKATATVKGFQNENDA